MAFLLVSGPLAPSVFGQESDVQKLEAQLTSELQKVNTKYQEIESLNQQIDSLNKEKETLAEKITTQEAKVEERKQVASKRLQQIQVSDFVSYSVLHLLNSESLSDFFNRLYVFQQLFQSDEEVLKILSEQAAELSRLKTAAEQASTDLVAKKEQLTAESQAFEGSVNDLKKLIADNKEALAKVDSNKLYSLKEASALLKEITYTKFDASVDIAVRLGVDPRKANQMVRGVVTLPHGTGKDVRVLALVTPDKEAEAKAAGADYVGLDEYLQKIKDGWTDVDVIVTMPAVMGKLGPLGRVLGPRGLMPNPKVGTVTPDVARAVNEIKAGKIEYRTDKAGIISCSIGKASFDDEKLLDNYRTIVDTIIKAKPVAAKGQYIKSVTLSATMGPGVPLNVFKLSTVSKEQ